MYCINCGEEVVEPAKFCIACGASIYRQEDGRQRSEPAAAVSRVRANWFVKHWYGDLPLAQSFWVNGFILFFVFDFGEWVLESFFPISEISLVTLYRWYAGVYVVRIIAFVWQSVGCWRSAQRHLKRGGSILWPRAAQGLIFLGFLFTIVVVPVAVHLLGQVIGLGANSNYTLTISADGEELAVVGDMAFDLPDEVAELLELETSISRVNLSSDGGLIAPAMRLGALIAQYELSTYVPNECDSACVLSFTAGTKRILHRKARLGFHRSSSLLGGSVIDDDQVRDDLRRIGASKEFIDKVMNFPPNDMWFPSVEELIANNIVTHTYDGFEFTDHR